MAFLYYGISFRISGFGVSIYLTQFIYGAIEVPAKILTFFVLDWIGRRNGQALFLITTGALIAINTAIPLGDAAAAAQRSFRNLWNAWNLCLIGWFLLLFQVTPCSGPASLWWPRGSRRQRSPRRSFTRRNSSQPSSGKTQT